MTHARWWVGVVVLAGVAVAAGAGEIRYDEPNPAAVAEVKAGVRDTASAAWWGFDAEDATNTLQSAIDSGAPTVVVPYMGMPWIVTPLKLRSDLRLVFEPGVVVLAKAGAFKGKGDSLFDAANCSNLTLSGYGATLRMRKSDYQTDAYEAAEWRMTLSLRGCRQVVVEGLRLESSGGDGIYIGAGGALKYCADVIIRDVVCHDHHRQGISIITAVDLLIENCVFSGTDGTAPRAGIDFEPNKDNEKLVNCVVRGCVMEDNAGAGILVYLKPLSKASDPVSILFDRCHIRSGRDAGVAVGAVKEDGPKGLIEFRDCTIENTAKAGMYVFDKSPEAARVTFTRCKWRNTWADPDARHDGPKAPLMVHVRRPQLGAVNGGIDFVDCTVYDDEERPVIIGEVEGEESKLVDVTGRILVKSPKGARADWGASAAEIALELVTQGE
ncbi:MAG: hypothetical protein GY851_23285 [bacterium]|nr:hypothetical protein [bacterium]